MRKNVSRVLHETKVISHGWYHAICNDLASCPFSDFFNLRGYFLSLPAIFVSCQYVKTVNTAGYEFLRSILPQDRAKLEFRV